LSLRHDDGTDGASPDEDPARFLAATRLCDSAHASVRAVAERVTDGARDDAAKAVAIHDFVRDRIPFGWAREFDEQTASAVLATGRGFCITKATLLLALLRAAGVPSRVQFVALDRDVLHGLVRPPSRYVDHCYAEAFVDGRWRATDSYIVDPPLFAAAVARCRAENRPIGYGVHASGSCEWNARDASFSQCADSPATPRLCTARYGAFGDLDDFRGSGHATNPTHWAGRLMLRAFTAPADRRVRVLRRPHQPAVATADPPGPQ
jgi:hypothetical protein